MKVGLFFGSFNPIHVGHLIIANSVVGLAQLDQVWFVISPQNPFKKKSSLLPEQDRLHLVNLAIEGNDLLATSNIEFKMPQPSYTIDTLTVLKEKHPSHSFSILMGSDNLLSFHKWKNYEQILENYTVIVYPRPGSLTISQFDQHPKVKKVEVSLLDISATKIRENIKEGKSIRYLIPDKVIKYIKEMHYYE